MEPDEAEVDPFQHQQNPMMNGVVLENMFDFCDVKNLSQFRLVSVEWNTVSRGVWRSTATVKLAEPSFKLLPKIFPYVDAGPLVDEDAMPRTRSGSAPRPETRLQQFLRAATDKNDPHRLGVKPFTRFHLERWILGAEKRNPMLPIRRFDAHPTPAPAQVKFWQVCGNWMRSLRLVRCSFNSVEIFWEVFSRHTPNLTELEIDEPDFDRIWRSGVDPKNVPPISDKEDFLAQPNLKSLQIRNHYDDTWPIQWHDMFRGFPNIKILVLSKITSKTLHEILRAIGQVRKEGKPISLKKFEVMYLMDAKVIPQTADLIRECQLPLEIFNIEFGDTEGALVKHFLQQCPATLRTLQCTFYRNAIHGTQPAMTFQTMLGGNFELLKDLRLNGPVATNFAFLQNTPNLELLHMDYHSGLDKKKNLDREKWLGSQVSFQSDSGVRLENLTEFKTERIIDNYHAFRNITKWMPNLTRLSAPLTDVTFPLVCTVWKSTLKELHITKEGIIGDEITGLGAYHTPAEGEFIKVLPPNITDLQELEKFTQDKGSGYFTDVVVLFGFRFLPKLRLLRIFVTKDLSPDALAILKKKDIEISWTKHED